MNIFGLWITTAKKNQFTEHVFAQGLKALEKQFDSDLKSVTDKHLTETLRQQTMHKGETSILEFKCDKEIEKERKYQQELHIAITKKLIDENVRMRLKIAGVKLPDRKGGK